uniref:Transmembrane protein n=1 Tax=Psilocybe cubensis TaxID=181762 RepID=A0A8H7XPR2_PSICU
MDRGKLAVQVIIGTISVLRTYALYGRSRRILILLCIVTVIAAAFGLFCSFTSQDTYTEADFPSKSCLLPLSDRAAQRQLLGWVALVAFEVLIFGLILYKSVTLSNKMSGTFAILDIMLRDGALYFGVIALSSLSVIITFKLKKEHERGMTATMTNALASSMITRLMLNLRDPTLASGNNTRFQGSSWTTQIDSMLPASLEDYTESYASTR